MYGINLLKDEQHYSIYFHFEVQGVGDGQQVEAIGIDLFYHGFYLPIFDILF